MERHYKKASSLAKRFFEDFPFNDVMPLQLSQEQSEAYKQYVEPLLELYYDSSLAACCNAVEQLSASFSTAGHAEYDTARAVADYIQSSLATGLIDVAGSMTLDPDISMFVKALKCHDFEAYQQWLRQWVRHTLLLLDLAHTTEGTVTDVYSASTGTAIAEVTAAHLMRCAPRSLYLSYSYQAACKNHKQLCSDASNKSMMLQPIPPLVVVKRLLRRRSGHYLLPLLGGTPVEGQVVVAGIASPSAIAGNVFVPCTNYNAHIVQALLYA